MRGRGRLNSSTQATRGRRAGGNVWVENALAIDKRGGEILKAWADGRERVTIEEARAGFAAGQAVYEAAADRRDERLGILARTVAATFGGVLAKLRALADAIAPDKALAERIADETHNFVFDADACGLSLTRDLTRLAGVKEALAGSRLPIDEPRCAPSSPPGP